MFPPALSGADLGQVNVFESQFGDLLEILCCYYAALTAAFHVEGLQPK